MRWGVGITTRNRPDTLSCCLAALMAQDMLPDRLVVVDQSSAPASETLAQVLWAYGLVMPLEYRPTSERGLWRGREAVIEVVRDIDVVVLLDDDMLLCPGALRHLLAAVSTNLFAVGTHVTADLRTGWTQPSGIGLAAPAEGAEHHWYVDMEPFPILGNVFADAFVAVQVGCLLEARERVRGVSFYQDVLAGVGRSDRIFSGCFSARGIEGVVVPKARAVHISPTRGEWSGSGERALAWVERKLWGEVQL